MGKRLRAVPTASDAEIGARIRQARIELLVSQRAAAVQMGISRDQLNHIERGEVAARFFAAWNFCRFSGLNPLWLAFGYPFFGQSGFIECANSEVVDDALFLDVMRISALDYLQYRETQFDQWERVGRIFSKAGSLSAVELRDSRPVSNWELLGEIELAISKREHYARSMPSFEVANLQDLRSLLRQALSSRGAKTALARQFNISTQAISHWLSGASAPTADTALRLRKWLADTSAAMNQQKSAAAASTAAAPKTRKGKNLDEKSKSDQRKQ